MSDTEAQEAIESEAANTETAAADGSEAEAKEAKANGKAEEGEGGEADAGSEAAGDSYSRFIESIKDEKARDYASRFKSAEEIVKGALDMRAQQSKMIPKLGKNPSEEQVEAYRKAIGAGQSVEDYEVPMPDGVELSEPDQELLGEFKQIALDNHIPVEHANAAASAFFKKNQEVLDQVNKSMQEQAEQEVAELKKEWGTEFDANVQAGIDAGQKLIGEDMDKLAEMPVSPRPGVYIKLGNLASFNKLLAMQGKRMGEDGVIAYQTSEERQSIEEQIEQIRNENPFPYDKKTQAKLEKLYAKLYPDEG